VHLVRPAVEETHMLGKSEGFSGFAVTVLQPDTYARPTS